jgi:DNA repair protein RadC
MKERLYQLRFDGPPVEVTPRGFSGLGWKQAQPPARFVREVAGEYTLTSPALAAAYFLERVFSPFEAFEQEELWALLLNTRLWVTHEVMVYCGMLNAISVRPVELFREAIRRNAFGLLLGHVHPSGDPTPSPEDIASPDARTR